MQKYCIYEIINFGKEKCFCFTLLIVIRFYVELTKLTSAQIKPYIYVLSIIILVLNNKNSIIIQLHILKSFLMFFFYLVFVMLCIFKK